MQTLLKPFITILLITVLFGSCTKTINFNSDQLEAKIVVNSLLIANSKITTSITKSQNLLLTNDFFEPLKNAKADLYVNDQFAETLKFESKTDTFIKQLNYGVVEKIPYDKGVFISETTAEAGKTYRLEVSCDGMDNVSCETTVPYKVEITSVDTSSEAIDDEWSDYRYKLLQVKFKDPRDISNYYRVQLDNTRGSAVTYFQEKDDQYIFSDTILIANSYGSYFNMADPIFKTSENEANDIIMGTPNNRYAIFDDSQISGKEYNITIQEYNNWKQTPEDSVSGNFVIQKITLYSINKDYFDYLNTANYHFYFDEDYFSEPVPVYSNVIGGLGIWGSANTSQFSIIQGVYPMPGKTYMPHEDYYKNQYDGYGGGYSGGY